jgi:truncated hemoglobin YjbI
MSWNLVEEVGGEDALRLLLRDFYDRLFADLLIGYFFAKSDKEQLIESQYHYLTAHLGDRSGTYEGPSIRRAHEDLGILPGHFDRRHKLLEEVLQAHDVPVHVAEAWLKFDTTLRDFVLREGQKAISQRYP